MYKKINLSPFIIFCLLVLPLGFGGCNSHSSPVWTVMVYMAGDNDLSDALLRDLGEMEAAGSSSRINIVVQIDTWQGTTRRLFVKRGGSTLLQDMEEQNMADPQTLKEFILWATTHYSAKRYALILSSHGDGMAKRIPQRSEMILEKILQDDTDGVPCCLSNTVVRQAIEDTGVYFDLLGFDASQTGQIETAYEFRNVAEILVFSQETGETNGWDYTAILRTLRGKPSMGGEDLASVIVESYRSFYEEVFYPENQTPTEKRYLTISAIGLDGRINNLSVEIDQLSGLLIEGLASDGTETQGLLLDTVGAAREETQKLNPYSTPYVYVDLMDFIRNLNGQLKGLSAPPPLLPILKDIEDKTSAILAMKEDVILAEYHGEARPNANGLSIAFFKLPEVFNTRKTYNEYKVYFPDTGEGISIQFINDTRWDEFLQTYYQKAGLSS